MCLVQRWSHESARYCMCKAQEACPSLPTCAGERMGKTGIYPQLGQDTVRKYFYDYARDQQFERSTRGRLGHALIANEEDVKKQLRKWGRHNVDHPRFCEAATDYCNNTLLPSLPAGTLLKYRLTLPVHKSTVHRWLLAVNIKRDWKTKTYFNDTHCQERNIKVQWGGWGRARLGSACAAPHLSCLSARSLGAGRRRDTYGPRSPRPTL